jgi:hypothetical protein
LYGLQTTIDLASVKSMVVLNAVHVKSHSRKEKPV